MTSASALLLASALALPAAGAARDLACGGVVTNGTRPGQDYASIKMNASTGTDPKDCQAMCCADHKCATWVFVPAGLYPKRPPGTFCWLKAAPIPLRGSTCDNGKPGCVSGVVNRTGGGGGWTPDATWKPTYTPGANGSLPTGVSSCAVDGATVFAGQRGAGVQTVLALDAATGRVTRGFGGGMFKTIHGMKVQLGAGAAGSAGVGGAASGQSWLWTTDSGGSVVSKWEVATGARAAAVGAKGQGLRPVQFGSVADVAFDASGDVYVSDGDGGINARVLKLDGKTMSVVWCNGNNGSVPSSVAFKSPHSLAYDATGHRIVVADRNNNQVRFLDAATGAYLGAWPPSSFAYPGCSLPSVWSVRTDAVTGQVFVATSNFGAGAGCTLPPGAAKAARIIVARPPAAGAPVAAPPNVTGTIDVAQGFPHEICVAPGGGAVYAAAVDSADLPPGTGIGALTKYVPARGATK